MMLTSHNPTTGAELSRHALHTPAELDGILAAANSAQRPWGRLPIADRLPLLSRMAVVLRAGRDRYARLITAEMGKPIAEAEAEIEKCAMTCDFYAAHAAGFLADEVIASSATESMVAYDPLGVVLAIMPWNYPFWQFFRFAAPALAAGNGAVLKHAANVCGSALAIAEVMRDASCPDGLVGIVLIDAASVAGIIADDRIAAVTLTGSTAVGSIVAAQAGRALKKQVLELGGSDPFIVLADADVEAAAATAVKARFVNGGQSCVNAKRFIVEDAAAERFVAAFTTRIRALRLGDPMQRDTDLGPMARENLRAALHDQVVASVAAGARLVCGGRPLDGPGFFYPATLLDDVQPGHVAFREETFGPVAAVIRARDAGHAVALANQTEFGLGAALWTADMVRARQLARQIAAGAVFINGMVASDPRLPFGGIRKSGYGRELGQHGIREFTNIKTVWIGPARPV